MLLCKEGKRGKEFWMIIVVFLDIVLRTVSLEHPSILLTLMTTDIVFGLPAPLMKHKRVLSSNSCTVKKHKKDLSSRRNPARIIGRTKKVHNTLHFTQTFYMKNTILTVPVV